MSDVLNFERVRREMLLRSIYLLFVPVMLLFAALACGTVVTDSAFYVCPTPVPPTAGPQPTYLPGTPIPLPTPIPPPPTPYRIAPPQDFYVGDAVFVGQPGAALRLRFRLQNVQTRSAPPLAGIEAARDPVDGLRRDHEQDRRGDQDDQRRQRQDRPGEGVGRPIVLLPEAQEDWHERVNEYVQQWTTARGLTISTLSRTDKQALVIALSANGAFGGKNAAAYISRILGMGRATVYKYLSQGSAP